MYTELQIATKLFYLAMDNYEFALHNKNKYPYLYNRTKKELYQAHECYLNILKSL